MHATQPRRISQTIAPSLIRITRQHSQGVGKVEVESAQAAVFGRVAVGLLPRVLAYPLSRLEPYGMLILIGLLILLPVIGAQLGLNLDVISTILRTLIGYVISALLVITGNA